MPFYEYCAVDIKKSCKLCKKKFEIHLGIKSDPLYNCPECGNKISKIITLPAAFVFKGRQCNQYSDVKGAKYWRDADGNKHKVQPGDGSTNSPTVSKERKRSDAEVDIIREQQNKQSQRRQQARKYKK